MRNDGWGGLSIKSTSFGEGTRTITNEGWGGNINEGTRDIRGIEDTTE